MPYTAKKGRVEFSLSGGDGVGDDEGSYTELPHCETWELTPSSDLKEYASSSTDGFMRREAGNSDFEGSIEFLKDDVDTVSQAFDQGMRVWFKLYENAERYPDRYHTVRAMVGEMPVEADIAGSELVKITVEFEGDGIWIKPTA